MKTFLVFAALLLAHAAANAAPALIPNVICDYGIMNNQWYMMGATIDYDTQTSGAVVLKNVSTSETYGLLTGPQTGICATMPILASSNKYILKIASYKADDDFNMDEDTCEFTQDAMPHQTLAHFKIDMVAGQKTQVGSDMLQMINYFLVPSEVKLWSQSEDAAQDAADKKCLALFPGSQPSP